MKDILKLKHYHVEKIWGWEKWVLSCHEQGSSVVLNEKYQGEALKNIINSGDDFPILKKIINTKDKLSVQVHPDDRYAQTNEKASGKAECWYILNAEEGAKLILGIKKNLSRAKLEEIIYQGKIENYLEEIVVEKGDFIYIPPGTVHAIGKGIELLEVQQNSNITYRLYDWGRGRETHIKKSLDVIDYHGKNEGGIIKDFKNFESPYFKVGKIDVNKTYSNSSKGDFHSYTIIRGKGYVKWEDSKLDIKEGDTIYIPPETSYIFNGNISLIKATI